MIGFKTVRFTKLIGKEGINLGDWVLKILEQLNFGGIMFLQLGISFTANKGIEGHDNYQAQYMYCPKAGATFDERFKTREEAYEWAKSLNGLDNPKDIMNICFLFQDFGEFFTTSGWTGRRPVAAHLWIQK